MKRIFVIPVFLCCCFFVAAQEQNRTSSTLEQQLENFAAAEDTEPEDDAYLQQLEYFRKHPLNINTAGADELKELGMLTGLQIQQFIRYRRLLGKLISEYELQAVPGWDITTIKKLLPFVIVKEDKSVVALLRERWSGGEHTVLMRYSQVLEKAEGCFNGIYTYQQ